MKEKAYQSKPLLTKREREVFELLVQDKTTKEIAGELFISEKTVRNHISNVMCSVCEFKSINGNYLIRLHVTKNFHILIVYCCYV
ncbi:helix-turn-helix domain-containing protein [Bacillus cereus group sp. TH177-1LC]|uniref:helix-turn-helix domain-containing protein n=1 Tax=Bacillus cereus group sp. TH177-1LC TaxID=3018055 RepID=UPI0022E66302|nr:helix-turn-helix transcriptional regulator [Bacillus cereus group sp. TH177-1LC]MDA1641864.1 helix-turn-helix transcriptional regulator [Bacillus cereus group sp. TH177-1LC]